MAPSGPIVIPWGGSNLAARGPPPTTAGPSARWAHPRDRGDHPRLQVDPADRLVLGVRHEQVPPGAGRDALGAVEPGLPGRPIEELPLPRAGDAREPPGEEVHLPHRIAF